MELGGLALLTDLLLSQNLLQRLPEGIGQCAQRAQGMYVHSYQCPREVPKGVLV